MIMSLAFSMRARSTRYPSDLIGAAKLFMAGKIFDGRTTQGNPAVRFEFRLPDGTGRLPPFAGVSSKR
jgi:hypothetical protein